MTQIDLKTTEERMKKAYSFVPRKARRFVKRTHLEWTHRATRDNARTALSLLVPTQSGTPPLFITLAPNPSVYHTYRQDIPVFITIPY